MFNNLEGYIYPSSIEEAVKKIQEFPEISTIIGGGIEVVKQASDSIKYLIDISKLGLNYIKFDNEGLHIGSASTIEEIASNEEIKRFLGGIFLKSAKNLASHNIRNRATIGGHLMGSYNPSDLSPLLLALDAKLIFQGNKKEIFSIEEFLEIKKEIKQKLLIEVLIPPVKPNTKAEFIKFSRSSFDSAIVNICILLIIDEGKCVDSRIVIGGVANKPIRIKKAETFLVNKGIDDEVIEKVSLIVKDEITPPDNIRATSSYRKEISCVLIKRALKSCLV